mgnify:FL=1|jgi:hypothetical protein
MIIGAIMNAIGGLNSTNFSNDAGRKDYQGAPYSDMGKGKRNMNPPSAGKAARLKWEANYQLFHGDEDDKPRQAARPVGPPPPPPIKTVDQFYAELSNKHLWGALPSLRMERGDSPAPRYGNVDLQQREGGVARSLFNPYGE